MTFDDITEDGRLWAVRYESENDNALYTLFEQWNDVLWLRTFFKNNWNDLQSYLLIKLSPTLLMTVKGFKV